jgi:hypothetical protein
VSCRYTDAKKIHFSEQPWVRGCQDDRRTDGQVGDWNYRHLTLDKTNFDVYDRSVRDLEVASRILFGQPDSLGVVAPVPFKDVSLPKKLKLGFYTDGTC